MKIGYRNLSDITPYADNPRRIPKAAVDAVAVSIKRYGFRQPIVVDADNVVIAGHTRLQAAQKLGLDSVPVHVADLTPEQTRAYRLADNRTNEFAAWGDELLTQELTALSETMDVDLAMLSEMTAFGQSELERMLAPIETDWPAAPSKKNALGEITFIVSELQREIINRALRVARSNGDLCLDPQNDNGNAAVLTVWASGYLEHCDE